MSPVGAIFVSSPPKTGTKLLLPAPPSIVERVILVRLARTWSSSWRWTKLEMSVGGTSRGETMRRIVSSVGGYARDCFTAGAQIHFDPTRKGEILVGGHFRGPQMGSLLLTGILGALNVNISHP